MKINSGVAANKTFRKLPYFFYLIFFLSVICAIRPLSSITIALILLWGIIENRIKTGSFANNRLNNLFFAGCFLFYLLQITALLYTSNFQEGLSHLQLKSALIFIPLALCVNSYAEDNRDRLMRGYICILAVVMVYCLIIAAKQFYIDHTSDTVFFYHTLVSPFKQHAIQFSILVFIGLIYLLITVSERKYIVNSFCHLSLIVFFLFFQLLLSSKLVIIFTAISLIWFLLIMIKQHKAVLVTGVVTAFFLILTCLTLFTTNPISARYNEIVSQNLSIVKKDKFSPNTAFNGLQFRILQWRFVDEILSENKAWVRGISPGDKQLFLDRKYVEKDMYQGDGKTDRGFIGYDTHNQFLESTLETGIIGLLVYITICIGMIILAIRSKDILLWATVVLLLVYSLNESVFETQYGLTLFVFFPLFFYKFNVSSIQPDSPS